MAPKETLSDLIKKLEIPNKPGKDVSGLIWDFLKKDPEKSTRTDEYLASCPPEDIHVFAAEFVNENRVQLSGPHGPYSSSTNKTLLVCHVRDIMNHLVRNRCKPKKTQVKSPNMIKASERPVTNFFTPGKAVGKSTRSPQAAKGITIEIGNPASEKQKRTSDIHEISDTEDISHIADALLSPQSLKSRFNTPKTSLSRPQKKGESSKSVITPTFEMSNSPSASRMTEDGEINKSPEKDPRTDKLPTVPQSVEKAPERTNTPSQPANAMLNTPPSKNRPSLFKSSLFLNRKRTAEDVEPSLDPQPSLMPTPTPNTTHPDIFGPELPSTLPSPPSSSRRVRPRTARSRSPSPTPAAESAPLIPVRGSLYRVDALAQVADQVLKYVRECENKCLKYEGQVQLPHQKNWLLTQAMWLKDMHNDLESRIESLAADSPANARVVTSWIERHIDQTGMPQVVAASPVVAASMGDSDS